MMGARPAFVSAHLLTLGLLFAAPLLTQCTNDGWGQWSDYTDCSRSCGVGFQHRTRHCLSERSTDSKCHGQSTQYRACNTQKCPSNSIDFRTFQCNSYLLQGKNTNNSLVTWRSHFDPSRPCDLICKNDSEEVKNLHVVVADGTECHTHGKFGVCINGTCKPAGCDHLLGSVKKEDKCLICGGSVKSCHTVSGSTKDLSLQLNQSIPLATFPAGATTIKIKVTSMPLSSIVLKSDEGRLLTHNTDVLISGSHAAFAGTHFTYKSLANGIAVSARGPLTEKLHLVVNKPVLSERQLRYRRQIRSRSQSPHVDYEYSHRTSDTSPHRTSDTSPHKTSDTSPHRTSDTSPQQRYSWVFGSWTSCSQKCGIGYQLRAVSCVDQTNGAASLHLCPQNEMPVRNQTCNEGPCAVSSNDEFKWLPGHWGECSVDCGIGEQTQLMHCMRTSATGTSSYASDDVCLKHIGLKPVLWRACNGDGDNCPYWATGSWSECSVTCGFGKKQRSIYCQQDPEDSIKDPVVLDNSLCPADSKPQNIEICSLYHCSDGSNNDKTAIEQLVWTDSPVVDCRTSRFGCCSDNITPAKGSAFLGCPGHVNVQVSDPCTLSNDRGPCVNYTIKWYFDNKEKDCLRFWYGGCQGNDNRFDDKDKCTSKCQKKEVVVNAAGETFTCARSTYGCCGDGVTSARGPNREGCPEFNRIGGCAGTRHGCCGDSVTAAEGPNREGCPEFNRIGGCAGTRYGCCEDGLTSASGPNKAGCPKRALVGGCAGTRYGCCADGVTSALGEHGLGCAENPVTSCETTRFGCCQDRVTAASGPNRKGCPEDRLQLTNTGSCVSSTYGCCSDGVTAAQGLNGEGCKSSSQDFCKHPKDAGTCNTYALQWHFESQSQSCRQFWYGGCGGNENRFSTKQDCEAKCAKHEVSVKTPACSSSPCHNGFHCQDYHTGSYSCSCNPDWGHNCEAPPSYWCFSESECGWGLKCTRSRKCKDGYCRIFAKCAAAGKRHACDVQRCSTKQDCVNDDSFEDGFFCENKIPYNRPVKVVLGCSVSEYGCCHDQQTPAEGPNYQGCHKKCEHTAYGCCPDRTTPAEGPNQEGCEFGSGDQPCEYTKYGCCADGVTAASGPAGSRGCGDTPDSEDRVTTTTISHKKDTVKHETCTAQSSSELCTEFVVKWRFDSTKRECARHWWGGCQDNGNVFDSQEDCEAKCIKTVAITAATTKPPPPKEPVAAKCTAPSSNELCTEYTVKWRFDDKNEKCVRHWWGGCSRNGNVFDAQEDCEAECLSSVIITNPSTEDPDFVSICDMPKEKGPCSESLARYFYDPRDRRCRDFIYGGCQGNENNFVAIEDCQKECMGGVVRPHETGHGFTTVPSHVEATLTDSREPQDPAVVCLLGKESGQCYASIQRWHYDHQTGSCSYFVYGGCGGNKNNFETLEQCNHFCSAKEVCLKPAEVGPCRVAIPRFHFDSRSGSCLSFTYGGCQGNLNNFATKEACERKCSTYKHPITDVNVDISGGAIEADVCHLNVERGNCRGYNIKWFYNGERNRCARFVYTGCDGNGNQFDTEHECTTQCVKAESLPDSRVTERPIHHQSSTTARPETSGGRPWSCHYSRYGCCEDGFTAAVDSHKSNCQGTNIVVLPGAHKDQTVVHVKPRTDAFLTCTLRGQDISWYRDGFLLESSPTIQVFRNGTLALRTVTDDLTGTYSCRASDGNNSPQFERFRVEVSAPLIVLPGPSLVSVKPGDDAFLHCHAMGSPQPRVYWSRNGQVLKSDGHYNVFGNGTLIIYNLRLDDAGTFECTAENGVSPPVSRRTIINIKETIGADIQRHQGIFVEGETIQLHCKGSGYPSPQLEWVKEGNVLKSDGKLTVDNGDLTVTSASIEDAGMYKCIASNGRDKAEDVTTVQIKFHSPHTRCEDSMTRTKCHLIVTGKLCGFRIFGNKCCQSCRRAGLL